MDSNNIVDNIKKCTGCESCKSICPNNAIEFDFRNGFRYPHINKDKCVNCHLCKLTCPAIHSVSLNSPINSFAVQSKDNFLYSNSASGGFFPILAEYIIEQGGVVCGASFDNEFNVKHLIVSEVKNLKLLQNSKYVQSEIDNVYTEIKNYLNKGTYVLFCGTPCQVAGLKNYLKKDFYNLYSIDLFCKGVPSPVLFSKYLDFLKSKYKKDFSFSFRSKKYISSVFPSITFKNNKEKILNGVKGSFHRTMGYGYVRESCIGCEFSQFQRVGDISIGDYHGLMTNMDPEKLATEILCNTEKGIEIFNKVTDRLIYTKLNNESISMGNSTCFSGGLKMTDSYSRFFNDVNDLSYQSIANKYLMPKGLKKIAYSVFPPILQDWIFKRKRNGK